MALGTRRGSYFGALRSTRSRCSDKAIYRFVMTGSRVRVTQAAPFSQRRRTAEDAGFSILQMQRRELPNESRRAEVTLGLQVRPNFAAVQIALIG
jgi:hypothetical protein